MNFMVRGKVFKICIGHGAPAILACLWLEDSMSTFLPDITRDYAGLKRLISKFSAPGGFPR
jgi:xylulose-5-phosphate/fructose-6-phosphate phosphoketolase